MDVQPQKIHEIIKQTIGLYVRWQQERPFNEFVKEQLKDDELVGAEIGVAYGQNAEAMLKLLPIKKLYLIDPYDRVDNPEESDRYISAKKKVEAYDVDIVFITKRSDEAVDDIKTELDFVYIDGDHSYDVVSSDIANYWQKVREGGILGGHDLKRSEVSKAVWEFSREIDEPFKVLAAGTQSTPDFALIK
jgi:hypothetical protein